MSAGPKDGKIAKIPNGDAAKGAKIFKTKCAQCHSVNKADGNKQGVSSIYSITYIIHFILHFIEPAWFFHQHHKIFQFRYNLSTNIFNNSE